MNTPQASEAPRHPVWDLPVRFIHWAIALCIPLSWWTAEEAYYEQHAWLGYAVIVLVLTRLVWGLVGSPQARFGDFVRGPGAILAYLRTRERHTPGHNPLGALSALLLWAVLLAQAGSGLFNTDEIFFTGPLNPAVSSEVADKMGELHEVAFNVLLGLIALHLAAIAYYQFAVREPMLGPMWRGYGEGRHGTGPAVPWWRALLVAVVLGLALWGGLSMAPEPESYW